ncbi:MAG: LLM class flavin-dependent oxidoreductase [Dehalococcoidia bacterium]|nr:LLM class flavin-dependent oxidoreductase [Dehalococcoidia bacterium]
MPQTIGVHASAATVQETIANIERAEREGLATAWLTSGGAAADPLAVFAAAALRTSRIGFGTSVIPTFPRHPIAVVQGAVAVDALAPGRLRLGVGPSHRPMIEGALGLGFERPLEHLREYLTVLHDALQQGRTDFTGRRITAHLQLPAPTGVRVLASALRPNAFRLCGEIAEGAISWVCPLPYIRDVAAPALRAGAEAAGRQAPPLIAHVPVVVSTDVEGVRATARRQLSVYPRLPFYSAMFQDAGFPEAANGELSDRMIDALVVHGPAETVAARLREAPSFAADELLATPLPVAGDPEALSRTYAVLGEVARA